MSWPTDEPFRYARRRRPARRGLLSRPAVALVALAVAALVVWAVLDALISGGPGARHGGGEASAAVGRSQAPRSPFGGHASAAATALHRELAREAAAVTRTAARMPYVSVAGRAHREVALTFDDGPGPYTPQVVRTLERLHAPATFFQIGFMMRWFSAAARDETAHPELFAIGDHTESHPFLGRLSAGEQVAQIDDERLTALHVGVRHDHLFRPPYGSYNAETLALLRQRHMLMVLWTVDSDDYRQPGVWAIVHNVLRAVKPGAIVLLHDAGGTRTQTIEAIPYIVRALRRRHYHLVTVPRLLADAPPSRAAQPKPASGVG